MQNYSDLIVYAIATIILVGSWVANILRKQYEERQAQDQQARTGEAPRSKPSLDDLAARRREELRRMAQERSEARPGAGEPSNLSMAERIARARAKAQYEQRARQAGMQPPSAPSAPPVRSEPTAAARLERAPQTEMDRVRVREQQRRQAEARQRQEGVQRARAEQQRVARQRELERQRQSQIAEKQRRQAEQAARQRSQQQTASTATRRPSQQAGQGPERERIVGGLRLTRHSLRDAVILRELLDRPLALRNPQQDRI